MENNSKQVSSEKITNNMMWSLAERIGAQGVSFIVSIVLTRLLTPEEFGLSSLVLIFATILSVFITSGMGTAIVQKGSVDSLDYSTAFWANLAGALLLYALAFFSAPYLAILFRQEKMTVIFRVLSINLIIGSLNALQHARISRAFKFHLFFRATLIGTVISAVVGIAMALCGTGAWALVAQSMTKQLVDTIALYFFDRWLPKFEFSFARLKPMLKFGFNAYLSALIDTIYQKLRTLCIGAVYSSEAVAYYNRGIHIPSMIDTNINTSIQSVVFPALTKCGGDKKQMVILMKKSVSMGSYLLFPCMTGLALVATPLISLLYTENWLACVPYLQIGCFVYALNPIHAANLKAILALGRSDISLKVEVFKKIFTVACLLVCVRISVFATAFSAAPLGVFALIVNAYPVGKLFGYTLWDQLKDMLPAIIFSAIMGVCVYFVGLLNLSNILLLALQVFTGAIVYLLLSVITKNKNFFYLLNYLRNFLRKVLKRLKRFAG